MTTDRDNGGLAYLQTASHEAFGVNAVRDALQRIETAIIICIPDAEPGDRVYAVVTECTVGELNEIVDQRVGRYLPRFGIKSLYDPNCPIDYAIARRQPDGSVRREGRGAGPLAYIEEMFRVFDAVEPPDHVVDTHIEVMNNMDMARV